MTSLQVVSVDCESHPAIVALTTENARVLFDAGEGVQRLAVEHKVRVGKMSNIFLTSHKQSSLGGLPGMLLTLFDAGVTDIKLTGTALAGKYLSATSLFMRPFSNFAAVNPDAPFTTVVDKVVISAIPILSSDNEVERLCYLGCTPDIAGKFHLDKAASLGVPKGPLFGKLKAGQVITLPTGLVVRPEDVLGDPEAGKHFAVIAAVAPHEEDLLRHLVTCEAWAAFAGGPQTMQTMVHLSDADTVDSDAYRRWLNSFGPVTQHVFVGHGCCEIQSSFLASSLHRHGLRSISSDAFAPMRELRGEFRSQLLQSARAAQDTQFVSGRALIKVFVAPAKKIGLEDVLTTCVAAQVDTRRELEGRVPGIVEKISIYRQQRTHPVEEATAHKLTTFARDQIIFLGTGCAIPSKYRNVSGILYYCHDRESAIVMDAGEGTWFQLISICPSVVSPSFAPSSVRAEEAERCLAWAKAIRVVWISHAHADHHLGLITLILERQRALVAANVFVPMLVVAPMQVLNFLAEVANKVTPGLNGAYLPVPSQLFDPTRYCGPCELERSDSTSSSSSTVRMSDEATYQPSGDGNSKRQRTEGAGAAVAVAGIELFQEHFPKACDLLADMGISQLQSIPVVHCPQAFALVIERVSEQQTMKVAYSGDTRPCDLFVQYAKGATVVIHEATFEDDKADEAVQKKHSTIDEALLVGKQIGAYRTLLTHFSQRYHGVPQQFMAEEEGRFADAIAVSDFMCLKMADLPWAPVLTSALLELLPPQVDGVADEEL